MSSPAQEALLLRLLAQRPVLGYEQSFKMGPRSLLVNRFLLGIAKQHFPGHSLAMLCERLNLPDLQFEILLNQLPAATIIHFGYEQTQHSCLYKLYLEFAINPKALEP